MNFIEIKYLTESYAILSFYKNKRISTIPLFQCLAYVGKNGIDKSSEGDYRTPTGYFHFSLAFGMHPKPAHTNLKYIQISENHYWCSDKSNYNQLVTTSEASCIHGEHLIEYPQAYEYALVLDYNKECIPGLGSAIFLHCTVPNHFYTAGCIAVNKSTVLRLIKLCDKDTVIWIHK